ncbi:hypothetical protein [Novosphingobium resinovorum]|uniref:hypothetical protein n=1 Tax=Novosphingobium resinovorum TaxID=158500 RepID=UPI002ED412B7
MARGAETEGNRDTSDRGKGADHPTFARSYAKMVHELTEAKCSGADTRQYGELTKINLGAAIEAFDELVGPANDRTLSADKMGAWAEETFPQFAKVPYDGHPYDTKMSGGGYNVAIESETAGGNQAVAKDAQKLRNHPGPVNVRGLFVREKSAKHYGREDERALSMSKDGKGPVMLVEERLANKAFISSTIVKTKLFQNGEVAYESQDDAHLPPIY